MASKDSEYYGARERTERAAAESASCHEARRAHLELADFYAKIIADGGPRRLSPSQSRTED